jgi:hypothetical protein
MMRRVGEPEKPGVMTKPVKPVCQEVNKDDLRSCKEKGP